MNASRSRYSGSVVGLVTLVAVYVGTTTSEKASRACLPCRVLCDEADRGYSVN